MEEAKAGYRDRAKQNILINELENKIRNSEIELNHGKEMYEMKITELNKQNLDLKSKLMESMKLIEDIDSKSKAQFQRDLNKYKEGLEKIAGIDETKLKRTKFSNNTNLPKEE